MDPAPDQPTPEPELPAAPPESGPRPVDARQRRARLILLAVCLVCGGLGLLLLVRFAGSHAGWSLETGGRDLVPPLLAGLGFVFFLLTLLLRTYTGTIHALRNTAIAFSFVCLVGLSSLWYIVDAVGRQSIAIGTPLTSPTQMAAYLDQHLSAATGTNSLPHIPTGLFLQSISFTGANDVVLTGYVWQKYPKDYPTAAERGFVMPEAVENAYGATEAYRTTLTDGSELIGWYFHADTRQQFFYENYPFDRQDVWLRLWYKDFNRGAVLTPDFVSYANLDPASLPGMDSQFVFDGWNPEYSVFSYNLVDYNSDFGYGPYVARAALPELYYSVGLKRDFFNTFISHIVPLCVVAFLLFAVLISTTKQESGLIGFNAFAVLGYGAALFFVVIIDHTTLRNSLSAQGIIYLDYFYFVLYLSILLISVNAILLTSNIHIQLIEYRDNALPKLLFWPLVLGILFVATVYTLFIRS